MVKIFRRARRSSSMIILVGCVKTKVEFPTEAGKLYISPLFKKTVRFIQAEPECDDWFILSAKYGLIEKTKIIAPYELTLNSFSSPKLKEWAEDVFEEIKKRKLQDLHFYCGSRYHNAHLLRLLDEHLIRYHLPLLGKTLGQRLRYFNSLNQTKGFDL